MTKGVLRSLSKQGLESSMQVGLIRGSISEQPFEAKPLNKFGKPKKTKWVFYALTNGDGEVNGSDILACLLACHYP